MKNENDKTKGKRWIMFEKKRKIDASKINNINRGNKPKVTGGRKKTTKISRQDQTRQTKQDIPKHRKKILPASSGGISEVMPITGWEGKNNFRAKYRKEVNKTLKPNG